MQTPYFTCTPGIVKKNFIDFKLSAEKYLGDVVIAYSVKTNSVRAIIETLSGLGSSFDIASINELNLVARKKCLKIFNGPAKTKAVLRKALNTDCFIVVDSLSELEKIIELQAGKKTKILVRVALQESKFGVDETQLVRFISHAHANNISVIGLHFHSGTQLSLSEFEKTITRIYQFLKEFFKTYPHLHFHYLDLGGGFADPHQLKNMGATLIDYFEIIRDSFADLRDRYDCFILEPGRAIVSDACCLITSVVALKENFDRTYAILDAGINVLPKIALSQFIFSKYKSNKKSSINNLKKKEYMLAGPLLFGNDIVGRFIGELHEGDILIVDNVGAYCYNLAWEISFKKPRVIFEKK